MEMVDSLDELRNPRDHSVQILDVPVPQMGDQLLEFMKMHDTVTLSRQSQCPRSLALSHVYAPHRTAPEDGEVPEEPTPQPGP